MVFISTYLLIYRLGPKLPSSTTFTNTDSLHDLADGTFVGMTASEIPWSHLVTVFTQFVLNSGSAVSS